MIIEDITILIVILFLIIMLAFTIRYYKLIILAQGEYEKAKNIISVIVLTFKKRLDKRDETVDELVFQNKATQSSIDKVVNEFQNIDNNTKNLALTVESMPITQKTIKNSIDTLKNDVKILSENQLKLEKQFVGFEERIQSIRNEEKNIISPEEDKPSLKLTETEQIVLEILTDEGAKSAPEVEKKISKTREHTARLMKKLWQEGYIERDTHLIPYVYRITENLKKMETDLNPT